MDESQSISAASPDPGELRQTLVDRFNLEELRNLCQDLQIDYDSLPGEGKEAKARELIAYCQRHNRMTDLVAAINRAKPEPPTPDECPYKGLQHFDEADADLFFGRESLSDELARRLDKDRFLAIVGASGSGKSSVVRAGMIPRLRQDKSWAIAPVFSPSSVGGPFYALAGALLDLLEPELSEADRLAERRVLAQKLRASELSVNEIAERILQKTKNASRLLIVVDQFEQVFILHRGNVERRAFVDSLLQAATEAEGRTTVVIVLRADFYERCAQQFGNLFAMLDKHQANIPQMTPGQLRDAIEEPAKRNGWILESGLVDLFLRDLGVLADQVEPGALPLLSYALLETWNRRSERTLTLDGYMKAGRIEGAISNAAEQKVFEKLKPGQQTIAHNILLRLVEVGEDAQATRRRATLDELVQRPEARSDVETALRLLTDARLITTGKDETVEIAHEALIRAWPRLREWVHQSRDWLRFRSHLTDAAVEWAKNHHDKSFLYTGVRLAEANEWAQDHSGELNTLERDFLNISRAQQKRESVKRQASWVIGTVVGMVALLGLLVIFQARIPQRAFDRLINLVKCGDLSGRVPKGSVFVRQIALDSLEGDGTLQCVVFYRYSTRYSVSTIWLQRLLEEIGRTALGDTGPVFGNVYRRNLSQQSEMSIYALTLPDNMYLGTHQEPNAYPAEALSGSSGPVLVIEDKDIEGVVFQVSIFLWQGDGSEMGFYKSRGWFTGNAGIKLERDKVTTLDRLEGTRSQLAVRKVYVPRSTKSYYVKEGDYQDMTRLVDPETIDLFSLGMPDDQNLMLTRYPENLLFAFYERLPITDSAKLNDLMPKDVQDLFASGDKKTFGCLVDPQLTKVYVQDIDIGESPGVPSFAGQQDITQTDKVIINALCRFSADSKKPDQQITLAWPVRWNWNAASQTGKWQLLKPSLIR